MLPEGLTRVLEELSEIDPAVLGPKVDVEK